MTLVPDPSSRPRPLFPRGSLDSLGSGVAAMVASLSSVTLAAVCEDFPGWWAGELGVSTSDSAGEAARELGEAAMAYV